MTSKKAQRGFTLIELAIIIAVLGILGAVGALKISSMNADAQKAGAMSALSNARSALAMAVAKSNGASVKFSDLSAQLNGTVGAVDQNNWFKWDSYNIQFEGTTTAITGIASASYAP
ncbi:hypothetical protein D3C86_1895020 [compost metagenome]